MKLAAAMLAVAALVPIAQAAAATKDVVTSVSSNWAGYAVSSLDPTVPATYTTVSGSWVQPIATCSTGSAAYSAFWVGLGGLSDTSQALEQIGTESNCSASGRASYGVWYELVPDSSVPVKLKIFPGNRVSASVTVAGQIVTVKLKNLSRKTSFTKRLTMAYTPDLSSAEWIAEAPSSCSSNGQCTTLPLANFGTVAFTSATATTADGHLGTIADPVWAATAVQLQGVDSGFARRFGSISAVADALPSDLGPDGAAFSVAYAPHS